MTLKAPFPWFGGKRRVASVVWRAFGPNINNYVEPFMGSCAVLLGRPGGPGKIETVNDKDRMVCVAPDTRVLMADMTWRRAGELKQGDPLLAFDEENTGKSRPGFQAPSRYRRWRVTHVVAAPRAKLPCYRLTFDDGTSVVASEDHCWLAGSHKTGAGGRGWRWVRTKSLVCNRKTQRSWVLKVAEVTESPDTWDVGWIAGICDGEGSVVSAPAARIVVSQNPGPILDKLEKWLVDNGFDFDRNASRKCVQVCIRGGLKEQMRFLMLVRPIRLLRKFLEVVPECSLYGRKHSALGLVSKEFLGTQEVVALSTTSKTFVAEGLASHNCNFWRAVAADPNGVATHANWPVNEADLHARHAWLVAQLPAMRVKMHEDPHYFDPLIAGWWVWGICQWIGGGWCVEPNNHKHPKLDGIGKGVHSNAGHLSQQMPHLSVTDSCSGRGVHKDVLRKPSTWNNRPHLNRRQMTSAGQGVHLPSLGNDRGIHGLDSAPCTEWFRLLQDRLRRVRVACGDWKRVLGPSVLGKGKNVGGRRPCAVFLDPPYDHELRDSGLYAEDDFGLSRKAAQWAIKHGDDPDLRIALCGYEGEHDMPSTWTKYEWKAARGYSSAKNANRRLERIWFSPHCLPLEQQQQQTSLFERGE